MASVATSLSAMVSLADTASHSQHLGSGYVSGGTIQVTTTYANTDAPAILNGALALWVTLPAGWTISAVPGSWSSTTPMTFNGVDQFIASTTPSATPVTVTYTINTTGGSGTRNITQWWRHKRATGPDRFVFYNTFALPDPLPIGDVTPTTTTTTTTTVTTTTTTTTTAVLGGTEITALYPVGNAFVLEWSAASNGFYQVESTPSLVPVAWSNVPGMGPIPGSSGTLSATDTNASLQKFYRVLWTY